MKKAVLYFVYFVALANLLFFLYAKNTSCVGVFFLAALLTSFFSKNKIVILVVAMVVGNVLYFGERSKEGFFWFRGKRKRKKTRAAVDETNTTVSDMKTTVSDMATKINGLYNKEFPPTAA